MMKRFRNISLALIISLMGVGSSAVYAFPAIDGVSVNAAQPTIKASVGSITLNVPGEDAVQFHIYSITGQAIKTVIVHQGSLSVELPRGYYIVKCSHWSKTVIVK